MADFNYYLNRAGVRGLPGVKGDQGDSPIITVQTETPNEYILKITNPDGTELISPNLRGNKININEGTYVRYNTETGELYTSTADGATGELAGVVRLATDADITGMSENTAVTPSQLADALSHYLVSPDGSVKIVQSTDNSLTELTVKGGLTDLPIASADTLGAVKIGENLSITADGVLSSTASGDVSGSGDNTFTGTNDFNGAVNLNGITTAENLTVVRNLTSSGEINAVSIKSTGVRSDNIKTTTNKKYLTEEDVDNQTIQIVDDKLHANFDEINGEINDVSTRVTTLEGQVGDISTTVDSNTTDIGNLKETKNNNIFDINKFIVIGNPTITNDGIASGFSAGNALATTQNISYNNSFEIIFPDFILSPYTHDEQNFITVNNSNFVLNIWQSRDLTISLYDGTSAIVRSDVVNNLAVNTLYSTKLIFENDTYKFYVKGGIYSDWTETWSYASSLKAIIGGFIGIGTRRDYPGAYFEGSIDLKQFSITVDGKEVFNGLMNSTKPIYDAIKANNTELSEFKTETSTDFSAVNSALNEKANLSDLGLKQNTLVSGDNITLTNNEDGTTTIAAESTVPTNMVTTDTTQTISGDKTFTRGITTTNIFPSGEITFNSTSQYRYINYVDSIAGGYHTQNGYLTFKGDTTLVGDNKLVLDGRTGGLKLTAASSANITCENDLIAPNIRTTANGTIKLTHPMNTASGLITLSNDYGQLSISSSLGGNNNLLGVVRGTAYALINGDNITTRDKDGNERIYINSGNLVGSDNITISNPTNTVPAKIDISQALLNRIAILETTVASLQTQIGEMSAQLDEINGEVI